MKYFIGIDLGGTTLSVGVFSEENTLLHSTSLATRPEDGEAAMLNRIAVLSDALLASVAASWKDVLAVGMTIPGLIESEKGPVVFAPNVRWRDSNPVTYLQRELGCPIYLFNDAACAAIAESRFGHGQDYRSFLFLTLGTAVGGAVVWKGRLFSQHGRYGSELGHIPLRGNGIPCSCGLPGCFQQYGSANALVRQTEEAMRLHPESILWKLCEGQEGNISAHTVFQGAELGDALSAQVIDQFTTYLAEGIAGLVNIFRPEAVIIGGGLSNASEALLCPTREKLFAFTYASEQIGTPPILRAQLGDSAGMCGAALLAARANTSGAGV